MQTFSRLKRAGHNGLPACDLLACAETAVGSQQLPEPSATPAAVMIGWN